MEKRCTLPTLNVDSSHVPTPALLLFDPLVRNTRKLSGATAAPSGALNRRVKVGADVDPNTAVPAQTKTRPPLYRDGPILQNV